MTLQESHGRIWGAIDRIARAHGLSTSGLALSVGLDATAFNPSKRAYPDGRLRWPSTGTVCRIMQKYKMDFAAFGRYM
ncbi:MAG: hypothetical protein LBO78_01520 [Rickettsiales bacterium]|jgi:phage repressor protein C with HTH and peptisase S24 domain|nr:hypothetical protein [Rickettsiales bacterium]